MPAGERESIGMSREEKLRLLLFNLATDADDPVLGFTTSWIRALAQRCETIDVITMRKGRVEVPGNVRVHSVGKELGYSEPRRAVEFYRNLFAILRHSHIDACFAHMMPVFAVMGAPLLKFRRIPLTLWYTHKSVTPVLRLAEKLSDRVVTASPESFRLPSNRVVVTGHGIDTDTFVPPCIPRPPTRAFTIVSVGRIAPIKGLETLIEATRLLLYQYDLKDLQVRLVGSVYDHDNDYASALHRQVIHGRLEDVVQFVGPVPFDRVVKEYQQADVFVNLSNTDSLDKAVLEAMSCGVPVITSNLAFRRVLGDLATDLMVFKDDPRLLAERLRALYEAESERRRALGERLRGMVVQSHSLERLVRYLVQEILQPPKRSSHPRVA